MSTGSRINVDWDRWEAILHADPSARGLPAFRQPDGRWLDQGQLRTAAEHLATHARHVGILTGFSVRGPNGMTIETDGPPGAIYLARVLNELDVHTTIVTDAYGAHALRTSCRPAGLSPESVLVMPFDGLAPMVPERHANDAASSRRSLAWCDEVFDTRPARDWTHLISIERCGPCHTLSSMAAASYQHSAATQAEFARLVPAEARDRCHNMRGHDITPLMAKTHLLFETIAERRLPITTIGIADGGNEIGAGAIAWDTILRAGTSQAMDRIACRIATDFLLLAGVSNWGGYALALGVAALRGQTAAVRTLDADSERAAIEHLVRRGEAVDGLTLEAVATVDGLKLDDYLEPLRQMRTSLGLSP
ncbi:MAG: DUF4392 domain-containing protein [Planctomycetes bacterium]|nr:DUF4392 domain-containing protein [Planctomycetota bacterium]